MMVRSLLGSDFFKRLADSSRITQAIKRVGYLGGRSVEGVLVPDEECDSEGEIPLESDSAEKIPDRMPVPRVPHPSTVRVMP